jgi:pimeloyl-ACP methyl ester carboxylesterase
MGFVLLIASGALLVVVLLIAGIVLDARHPARATEGWALAHGHAIDPAALGVAFEELTVAGVKAWRISGGDASGPTTLIIHGWRRSRIDSLRRLEPWLGVSRAAWLVDLAGHGHAPPGPTTLGAGDGARLVIAANEMIARDSTDAAPSRLMIVGHSLGAVVAIDLAARLDRAALAGVIAFAPYDDLAEPISNRLAARGLRSSTLAAIAATVLRVIAGRSPNTRESLRRLANSHCPLLVASSRADEVVRSDHVRQLAIAAGAPLLTSDTITHDQLGTSRAHATEPAFLNALSQFAAAAAAECLTARTEGATTRRA